MSILTRDRRRTPLRPNGQSLAIVLFGPSRLAVLRMLDPAYRHCMVIVQDRGSWHLLDPRSNALDVIDLGVVHPKALLDAFQADGYVALAVQRRAPCPRLMPLFPFTCVEVVKRTLGISTRRIVTPKALWRYLTRCHLD